MFYTSSRLQTRRDRKGFYGVLSFKDGSTNKELRRKLKATTRTAAKLELEEWRQKEEEAAINKVSQEVEVPYFLDYAGEIVEYRRTMKEVSGARIQDYRDIMSRLERLFPKKRVNEYTSKDIEKFYESLKKQGKSNHTVRTVHYFLKMVFDKALKEELIIKSPMQFLKAPKKENLRGGINSLSLGGARDFIATLSALPPSAPRMAAFLAFYTGMRRGECCGLRWEDIDFDNKVIKVKRAIGKAYDGNSFEIKDTKTHQVRDVAIPGALLDELKTWKERQGSKGFVLGHGEEWSAPDFIGKKYAAMIEALGIRGIEGRLLTFHDLRHTYATITIAQGADVVSVASQLGHADVSMTLNTYASVLPQAKKQVASIMDKLTQ